MAGVLVVHTGLVGGGKTHNAKLLSENSGYKIVSFASPLREKCWEMLGFEPVDYDNFKKRLLYLDELPDFVSSIFKKIFPAWQTGREYMCAISDGFKVENKDIWTQKTMDKIWCLYLNEANMVVDDARFDYECQELYNFAQKYDMDIKFVFCDYRSSKYVGYSTHNSEQLSQYIRDSLRKKHLDEVSFAEIMSFKKYNVQNKV